MTGTGVPGTRELALWCLGGLGMESRGDRRAGRGRWLCRFQYWSFLFFGSSLLQAYRLGSPISGWVQWEHRVRCCKSSVDYALGVPGCSGSQNPLVGTWVQAASLG